MMHRNLIHPQSKYDVRVALIFSAIVFLIILFSGCMRQLQPALEQIAPQVTGSDIGQSGPCYPEMKQGEMSPSEVMLDFRYGLGKTVD